jgi:predicted  nucleic acid-binding Zn-ribbon protein
MLMGVSNSLYVGSKLTQSSPLAVAQTLKLEWDVLRLRADDLEKETAALEAESEALQQAMTQEKDRRKKQELADQKSLLDRKLVDLRAKAAKARSERDEREASYKKAVAALAPARTTA